LLPADVARENTRIRGGRPVLIDIDLRALGEIDAQTAVWMATNVYKQYKEHPRLLRPIIRVAPVSQPRFYSN
jgi:hypothetical protein